MAAQLSEAVSSLKETETVTLNYIDAIIDQTGTAFNFEALFPESKTVSRTKTLGISQWHTDA